MLWCVYVFECACGALNGEKQKKENKSKHMQNGNGNISRKNKGWQEKGIEKTEKLTEEQSRRMLC